MKYLVSIFAILAVNLVYGSTFVGNGGNAGDVELQITLGAVQKTFEMISQESETSEDGQNLCVCTRQFEGRPTCDFLKRLSQEQVRFCSRYLRIKARDLAQVLSRKGALSLSWTHEQIEVRDDDRVRGADAVTNVKDMSMTLNQKRFLEMDQNERAFLLSHEVFHLTSYQGNNLVDNGSIGPFVGADGSRQFINAMAASVVMIANDRGVFWDYEGALKLSKSYKKTYVTIGYQRVTTPNDSSTAFDIESASGAQLGVRYQLTPEYGAVGQMTHLQGKKRILTSIDATENRRIYSVGGAYRWFPVSNPLTRYGQSHFVFSGMVDFLSANYEFHDPSSGAQANTTSTGYTLGCNYFLPLNAGVWLYGGLGYSSLRYSFNLDNQVNLEYNNNGTSFALGVAYGF